MVGGVYWTLFKTSHGSPRDHLGTNCPAKYGHLLIEYALTTEDVQTFFINGAKYQPPAVTVEPADKLFVT